MKKVVIGILLVGSCAMAATKGKVETYRHMSGGTRTALNTQSPRVSSRDRVARVHGGIIAFVPFGK